MKNLRKNNYFVSDIETNNGYEGVSIELQTLKAATQNQPIDTSSPLLFTERKDGVLPETDIRTDKWDIACEKMDYVSKMNVLKRTQTLPKNDENNKQQTKE